MEANNAKAPRLFRKDFTLVVIGQIISLFGNAILRLALPLYILQQTNSPALFGLVSASAFIPLVVMSPVGGLVADRLNKQRIMVVLDTFTALLIALFMLLMGRVDVLALVVGMMILLYGIQGAYAPAVQASIPLLAAEEQLLPANAAVNLVQSLSGLIGPVLGGMLFARFGLWPILVVSCGCFAFSALLELFIRIPHQRRPATEGIWAMVKGDMGQSARFIVKENPVIGRVTLLIFCINLVMTSMLVIGLPILITGHLGLGSEWYGYAEGAMAAGGLLGGVLAGLLAKKLNVQNAWLLLLACAVGILPMGLVLLAGVPSMASYLVITGMSAFLMVCSTIFSIQMLAFVQANAPGALVGKVISFVMAVSMCSQPLGQVVFGLLFQRFSGAPALVVLATAAASIGVALYSKSTFRQLAPARQPG